MSLLPSDRFVQVGAVRARYWDLGHGGETALLVHGLGGSVEDWKLNVDELAAGRRVVAVDVVGNGLTDKPRARYTLEFLSRFVAEFMDALGLESAHLCGLSLGGAVVLDLASRAPARAKSLVLADSAGLGPEVARIFRAGTLPLVGELLARPTRLSLGFLIRSFAHDPAAVDDELVEAHFQSLTTRGGPRAFLSTLRASATWRGVRPEVLAPLHGRLAHVDAPALIVWGRQDPVVPLAHAHAGAARLGARVEIFERCGHLPQIEHPERFNRVVREFWAEGSYRSQTKSAVGSTSLERTRAPVHRSMAR